MAKEYKTFVLSVYDEDRNEISIPAIRGKGAYEYAIEDGYTGSEEDYKKDINPENIKEETETFIISELTKRGQLKPEFAENLEWLEANGDQTKLYVLPDGMIYAWMLTEKEVSSGGGYTNALDGITKNINQRWSHSSKALSSANGYMTVVDVPVKSGQVVYTNVPRTAFLGNYPRIVYRDASGNYVSGELDRGATNKIVITSDDVGCHWTAGYVMSESGVASSNTLLAGAADIVSMNIVFNAYRAKTGVTSETFQAITEADVADYIVSIGNPIGEGSTEIIEEYAWTSTGHAFVPADYEPRIIELEKKDLNHTARIIALEKAMTTGDVDESEKAAYTRIKNWKYPIHEDAPVFLLETNKPAIPSADWNTNAVYAKYDALMNANSHYITRQNCGMASDGTTPIYVYHFKEPEPHYNGTWSETKPVILVCSGVHPTEQSGVWSMYYAMEEITSNKKLLDLRRNIHFIIMPMINPTGFSDSTYGVRNPDGIQVHYNFEVDFKYPTDSGYVAHGNRNHGGETPLSIPETQYFDALMQEYKDTLTCVLSCHNNDVDTQWGTGFVWSSCATHFMCNLGFRLADKLSAAWREKHGAAFDEGVRWANNYALTKMAEGSSIFTASKEQAEWDFRVGRASISGSGGTEYKQALKYGVHGINVEVCDRCMILDKDFNQKRTSNVTTMGCETYVNFFRTFMAVYDPKNKQQYAPNLPWSE